MEQTYYAGVGSRKAPADVLAAMSDLAAKLADLGLTLRSGHAEGSDYAFEQGSRGRAEVFVPWARFNAQLPVVGTLLPLDDQPRYVRDKAVESIRLFHPAPESVLARRGLTSLMARNFLQVCGVPGEPVSAFIACWTPAGSGTGGTGQAIRIARAYGIPVLDAGGYADLADWQRDVLVHAEAARNRK